MPKQNPNLLGESFGRLAVVGLAERKPRRGGLYWVCQCECGRRVIVSTSHLKSGHTTSCGYHRARPPAQAGITSLLHRTMAAARIRGIAFLLTRDEFTRLTSANCHYCGAEPRTVRYGDLRCMPSTIERSAYRHNGIDRVDSSLGYVAGNCVPCCKRCNLAKHTMSTDEFRDWVAAAYRHMFGGGA